MKEVDRYWKVKQNIKADPLGFWQMNEKLYSTLAKLARRHLNLPATSVPSEKSFSTTGLVVNNQRCLLSDENIEILCCLNNWTITLTYFARRSTQVKNRTI